MAYLLFVAGTALLAFLSRHCLTDVRAHGFYRFLAWECILVLAIHNVPYWFIEQFAWYQCVSWVLLFSSLALLASGLALLHRHGARDYARQDAGLFSFEKTARLVTRGVYGLVRHPLYGSLVLLAWGLYFKQPFWWPGALAALGASLALQATAIAEERENIAYFGADYLAYMQGTRRLLPWLW